MTTAKQVNDAQKSKKGGKHDGARQKVDRKFDNDKLNALFAKLRRIREERDVASTNSND